MHRLAGSGVLGGVLDCGSPCLADGLAAEDLDADGDLDLLAIVGDVGPDDPGGGVCLFRNDLSGNHWLDLGFTGPDIPYGAVVTIVAGGRTQHRQYWPTQVGGSAYRGPLHFGLGAATEVTQLDITWPDGRRTTLRNVAADQLFNPRAEPPAPSPRD